MMLTILVTETKDYSVVYIGCWQENGAREIVKSTDGFRMTSAPFSSCADLMFSWFCHYDIENVFLQKQSKNLYY